MAPLLARRLRNFSHESIKIVTSALVALMKDQVSHLPKLYVPAAWVCRFFETPCIWAFIQIKVQKYI